MTEILGSILNIHFAFGKHEVALGVPQGHDDTTETAQALPSTREERR